MPSKRELIGDTPPSAGLHWSTIRWGRITAFIAGIFTLVGLLYLPPIVGSQLPVWTGKILPAIPAGLMLYGLTRWPWQTVLKATAGIAAGGLLAVSIP